MSGVISIGDNADSVWLVAGWAFGRFLSDMKAASSQDDRYVESLQQADALHGLHVDLIAEKEPELARKLLENIKEVALATLREPGESWLRWKEGLDADAQSMYLDAVRDLLKIAERKEVERPGQKRGQN